VKRYVDFTRVMFGVVKMRIKGELLGLSGEWELMSGSASQVEWNDKDVIRVLKRVPEVSQLEQYIEKMNGDFSILTPQGAKEFFIKQGFKKAIEVAEEAFAASDDIRFIVNHLKKFAGVK
jgi:hypothetical protein